MSTRPGRAVATALVLALLGALAACGRAGDALHDVVGGVRRETRALGGVAEKDAAPAPAQARADAPSLVPGQPSAAGAAPAVTATTAAFRPAPAERKRVYSGFARLAVESVAEARDRIVHVAEERGGYVETIQGATIVIRVPAARFDEAFARVVETGRALEKRVETYDVTEQFQDLQGRLDIARRTRERLYALLERAADVKERLKILQEIRRLSEDIEKISQTLDMIARQVAFSRITAQLESRLGEDERARREIPFGWIAGLDPLYPSFKRLHGEARLDLGPDFAVFRHDRLHRAESAEGTRVRIGSTRNQPRGDARFWQDALVNALAPLYRGVERVELGRAVGVMLTSKDREPYGYLVAVVPAGRWLHVIEVFYPTPQEMEKRRAAVEVALKGLRIR
jgi:hypothetical protein